MNKNLATASHRVDSIFSSKLKQPPQAITLKEHLMSSKPPEQPSGSFEDYLKQELDGLSVSASSNGLGKKLELFAAGASIGWLGENSSEWGIITGKDAAVTIEPYVYNGVLYYKQAGTKRYLSVSDGYHYIGFYNWIGARGWTLNGNVLTSLYSNAQLSYYSSDNNYVYANASYTPLTVVFHDA
jgi:hypothetical protein